MGCVLTSIACCQLTLFSNLQIFHRCLCVQVPSTIRVSPQTFDKGVAAVEAGVSYCCRNRKNSTLCWSELVCERHSHGQEWVDN